MISLIGGGDDGDRDAAFAGAPGAANPMDIILGVGRHIEIEDMADVGNIETARRDVGADDQRVSPDLKASSAAMRARWSRSPCSAPALKPCFCRDLCKSATSRFRLQKMMAFLKSAASQNRRRNVSRFAGPGPTRRDPGV